MSKSLPTGTLAVVHIRFIVAVTIIAMAVSACGVVFGDAPEGNDFFESLDVSGKMETGAPLTAALEYETFYPVPVDVACELRDGKQLLREIGLGQAPAVPGARAPDDDRVPGSFAFDFSVEVPGTFEVECFTPCDENNFIVEEIEIARGPGVIPTATHTPVRRDDGSTPEAEPTRRPCGLRPGSGPATPVRD